MHTYIMILAVISCAVLIVGAFNTVYQIYHITVIDATARDLKHPKLWGLFAMNGNNSSGLLLYLIARKKYPLINLSTVNYAEIERRKKAAGIGLIFMAVGAIGFIISITFLD